MAHFEKHSLGCPCVTGEFEDARLEQDLYLSSISISALGFQFLSGQLKTHLNTLNFTFLDTGFRPK